MQELAVAPVPLRPSERPAPVAVGSCMFQPRLVSKLRQITGGGRGLRSEVARLRAVPGAYLWRAAAGISGRRPN
eukprot:3716320-Pyramimonas_sp.AAC.1